MFNNTKGGGLLRFMLDEVIIVETLGQDERGSDILIVVSIQDIRGKSMI